MSVELLAMVAVLPILVALILMVGMRWPATKAMPLAWLVCAVSGILVWGLSPGYVAAPDVAGHRHRHRRSHHRFRRHPDSLHVGEERRHGNHPVRDAEHQPRQARSGDHHRIHVCRLHRRRRPVSAPPRRSPPHSCWPSVFPPWAAAIICLVFNSFPVSFGAVGTPIVMGLSPLKPILDAASPMAA